MSFPVADINLELRRGGNALIHSSFIMSGTTIFQSSLSLQVNRSSTSRAFRLLDTCTRERRFVTDQAYESGWSLINRVEWRSVFIGFLRLKLVEIRIGVLFIRTSFCASNYCFLPSSHLLVLLLGSTFLLAFGQLPLVHSQCVEHVDGLAGRTQPTSLVTFSLGFSCLVQVV